MTTYIARVIYPASSQFIFSSSLKRSKFRLSNRKVKEAFRSANSSHKLIERFPFLSIVIFFLCFQCSTSCGAGVQAMDVKCVRVNSSGQAATVEENECTDIKPPTHVTCNADNPCNDDLDAKN